MADGLYLIWSAYHGMWWGASRAGYTRTLSNAGRYSREDAISICATARDGWPAGDETPTEIPVRESDALECAAICASLRSSTHG